MTRLNHFHRLDLQAASEGRITLTSSGFLDDDSPVDEPTRERLDWLWMGDYLDADVRGVDKPAVVELTDKGRSELARAEQESQR